MQDEGTVEQGVVGVPASGRLLHSDPHDFAGLYIRHRASFTLHARRYLRDGRDADEVVQEAFLRLFLALPELETELQALAYCRRTITNLCIDRFRAQARRPSLVDLDSAGALDLAEDDPGDPVVRAEDAATVRAALSMLSPLHRAALVKREIEEKSLPVIAEELEIPEESVKHVLFRARRALRRILASTSLAPGSDAELAGTLGKAVRSSSGGVAAFLLLLVLGLGTGPDLRAIPVVGSDLPELIPVTEIVKSVGDAVVAVAGEVATAVGSGGGSAGSDETAVIEPDEPMNILAPDGSPSPVASPSVPPSPTATPTPTPMGSVSPEPSASPSGSPSAAPTASPTAEPSPSQSASPEPTEEPSPSGSSSPSPRSSTPAPKPSKSSSEPARKDSKASPAASPSAETSPSAAPSASPRQDSPEAYQTEGLEWIYDRETGEMILVPLGQTVDTWRA